MISIKKLFKFGGELGSTEYTISGILGGTILMFLWWLASETGAISPKIFPNPIDVISGYPELIREKNLFLNMFYTISLNLTGYVYALIISIPLGFLIGIIPICRATFQKPLEALRFLALPAMTGLFISALGLGFQVKSVFLAVGILIYILPTVAGHVIKLQDPKSSENLYLQKAKSMKLSQSRIFWKIYVPFVMERSYKDICNLTAISYTYVTIAEGINREGGIGALIMTCSRQAKIPEVYALLLLILLIGVLQDFILKKLDPVFFPHHKQ